MWGCGCIKWIYKGRSTRVFNGWWSKGNEYTGSQKCLLYCFLDGKRRVDSRGNLILHFTRDKMNLLDLPEEMLYKILWNPDDPVQTMYNYSTCIATVNMISSSQIELLKLLHIVTYSVSPELWVEYAAEHGYLEVIKHLHRTGKGIWKDALDVAASYGHLEVVKWLHHNRDEPCTVYAMNTAAENGHLEVVKWLHYNRNEGCTEDAMDGAAENGYLETVIWLNKHRSEGCTHSAMDCAAGNGHLETVIWLHNNRTEGCTSDAMDAAAECGEMAVRKWLNENTTAGFTDWAIDSATKNGDEDTLQWLMSKR